MEGAAVAQVCYEHKVDSIVLRVISDKAYEEASIIYNLMKKILSSRKLPSLAINIFL